MRRWEWLRSRWAAVVIGLLVGAATGLAVFQGSRLTGPSLFVLCGTVAGGVTAVVIHGYARAIRLTEVTVEVPHLSELRFAVTRDNRQVAWQLFVESATRISIQRLGEDSGLVREAMNSLYTLFTTTREILTQAQPSRRTGRNPTVEHLAVAMLNNEIRPFLAKWHPRLRAWEMSHKDQPEHSWPENLDCRSELGEMQERLISYTVSFGELAGIPNVNDVMWGVLDNSHNPRAQEVD
jgi:hypothetical protein